MLREPAGGGSGLVASGGLYWVTVFGFPPQAASFVLEQLRLYGEVVTHESPRGEGNWAHVAYATAAGARAAIARSGHVFGNVLMLGVVPRDMSAP
jgi:nuclear pore complex protein Nup53